MRQYLTVIFLAALAAALSACNSQPAKNGAAEATSEAAAERPPAAFAQCMSCHTVAAGRNIVGPSLHGVVGRKAASLPDYPYSDALKRSGLTWDEATLDKWVAAPAKLAPGTKMVFFGMPDAAKRKELIDYLARQK